MYYLHDDWLLDLMRSDSAFLRKMGIKACVIDDLAPDRSRRSSFVSAR